jgi:hypothetical protein
MKNAGAMGMKEQKEERIRNLMMKGIKELLNEGMKELKDESE